MTDTMWAFIPRCKYWLSLPACQGFGGALVCILMALSDRSQGLISDYDYYGLISVSLWLALTGGYLCIAKNKTASTAALVAFLVLSLHMQISWMLALIEPVKELAEYSLMSDAIYFPAIYLGAYSVCKNRVALLAWGNYSTLVCSSLLVVVFSGQMPIYKQQIVFLTILLHPLFLCFLHVGKNLAKLEADLGSKNYLLQKAIWTDALTGLGTRSLLREVVSEDDLSVDKKIAPYLAVGVLDIDHFKKINDTFGHSTGDAALSYIGAKLQELLPESCQAIRWGGEEFVILCKNPHDFGVYEKIRSVIEYDSASVLKSGPLTVSIGVVCRDKNSPYRISYLLNCADSAVYSAKRSGRNRVVVTPLLPPNQLNKTIPVKEVGNVEY